jgi:enoyl-CoA hydratase/carnithine racemase
MDNSERTLTMIKEGKFTILETRGAVAKITINRPEKRNALSRDAFARILRFSRSCATTIPLPLFDHGCGDVAYCAGRDLSEFPTEGAKIEEPIGARNRAPITWRK